MKEKIQTFQDIIDSSNRIVFFGGAGVSTASGIPDFRSSDGIYSKDYGYPPEVMISHGFYRDHTQEFFDFYRNNMLYLDAEPNAAHFALTALEEKGKLTAVVTQNIDGLHQKAGTKNVLELHGSVLRNYCTRCGEFYNAEYIINSKGVPKCSCGSVIKPDVVLYQESLDQEIMEAAVTAIANADLLIVGGTSLTVYPAAGFVSAFTGDNLVIINMSPTPHDRKADLVISGNIAEVFAGIE